MRRSMLLIMTIGVVAVSGLALCQSLDSLDEKLAREAAKKALLLDAKSLQEDPEHSLKAFGLSAGGIKKLAEGNLGEGYRVYTIDNSGIEKLARVEDVTKVASFSYIEFPVLIDDNLTLLISMLSVRDSVTKATEWVEMRFGSPNSISKRAVELSKKYPKAQGYEMIQLYVNCEADFMIIRRGADYLIYWGFRSFSGSLWGMSNEALFNRSIPENEFLDILRSHGRAKAR